VTHPAVPPEMLQTFDGLARIIYSGESHDAVHQALCDAAVELIEGCDHASLMLQRHGRVHTAAASDDVALRCDQAEIALGEGPCLDAIDEDEPDAHLCPDLTTGSDWPRLAEHMLRELGVAGMAGFRLRADGARVGALNVFSDTPGALSQRSLDQASLLTSFASVALAALERGEEAGTLRRGLNSNREIGKAVGLLMATHGLDDTAAFALLSRVSQEMNLKVAEVAAQVVAKHAPPAG
jgi:hypothetical protein